MTAQLLVALLGVAVSIYFALLMIGFLFKLLFVVTALAIGVWAWRSWKDQR
jgi:hypothetical protein